MRHKDMQNTPSIQLKTILITVTAIALVALPVARAHEGEDHQHGTPAPVAASAADAWKTAQASLAAIKTAAAAKQHEPIHDEQEKLAAALKQIQEQGGGPDKARLDGAIKNAIAASEKVHTAADAKDFAKVDSSLKTLEAAMGMVEKQLAGAAK